MYNKTYLIGNVLEKLFIDVMLVFLILLYRTVFSKAFLLSLLKNHCTYGSQIWICSHFWSNLIHRSHVSSTTFKSLFPIQYKNRIGVAVLILLKIFTSISSIKRLNSDGHNVNPQQLVKWIQEMHCQRLTFNESPMM